MIRWKTVRVKRIMTLVEQMNTEPEKRRFRRNDKRKRQPPSWEDRCLLCKDGDGPAHPPAFHPLMSCPDCFRGSILDGIPSGAIKEVGGVDAYFVSGASEPTSKTFGVIYLTDAFGLALVNSKLIADKIANELACDVWVPDLFDGRTILEPSPFSAYTSTTFRPAHGQTGQSGCPAASGSSWSVAVVGQATPFRSHYLESPELLSCTSIRSHSTGCRGIISSWPDLISLSHLIPVH